MPDPLDDRLADAGRFLREDGDLDRALGALVEARAADAAADAAKPRHARKITPVIAIGVALAVVGAGAVAANQWGPWNAVPEADIAVTRDWSDINGNYLGTCESRMVIDVLPSAVGDLAREYLNSVDLAVLEPNPQSVAEMLNAVGRLDDVGRLVLRAEPSDFTVNDGAQLSPELYTDARILHTALTQEVFRGVANHIVEELPEAERDEILATIETQCNTDPGYAGER